MSIKTYKINCSGNIAVWREFDECIFIDPGFSAGITYVQVFSSFIRLSIYSVDIVKTYRGYDYTDENRYVNYFNTLGEIFPLLVKHVYCEDVFFRQGSSRSIGSVMSQDLFKTARLIGLTIAAAAIREAKITLLHAHTWRGQLNDELVKQRVFRKLNSLVVNDVWLESILTNSHICCSLGIMLHYVNLFNEGSKNVH